MQNQQREKRAAYLCIMACRSRSAALCGLTPSVPVIFGEESGREMGVVEPVERTVSVDRVGTALADLLYGRGKRWPSAMG